MTSLQMDLNSISVTPANNGNNGITSPTPGSSYSNSNGGFNPANVNFGASITSQTAASQLLSPSSSNTSSPLSIMRRKSLAEARFSASPVPSLPNSQKDAKVGFNFPIFYCASTDHMQTPQRFRQNEFIVEAESEPNSLKSSGSFFPDTFEGTLN